jgi:hypothetical protein
MLPAVDKQGAQISRFSRTWERGAAWHGGPVSHALIVIVVTFPCDG